MAALHPLTLKFRRLENETEFCVLEKAHLTHLTLPIIATLAALNVARIVIYGTSSSDDAEVAWASVILGLCAVFSCALCKASLKVWVVSATMILMYLTVVEWATTYDDFFCWQVRGLWVVLAITSVYAGTLIYTINWPVFAAITVLGGLYAILRTYFKFDKSDLFALLVLATVPAVISYWKTKQARLMYVQLAGLKEVI
jgi:hypothetical protein